MKILICGGRDFNNKLLFEKSIDGLINANDIIISGGAKGADALAETYAKHNNLETKIFLPQYNLWGKIAPLIRNSEMIKECDQVLAFWDGKSRGTKYTIDNANKNNKKVDIIYY
ncbi:MAG: DUF2493 domain-containing protein [Paraclostridium sp.]